MFDMSALELSGAIRSKEISVLEALNAYIDRIEKTNPKLNAFLKISKESAAVRARAVQSRIDGGEDLSPLAGVPIAVKDNISVLNMETTCASKMLGGYLPCYNAAVVEKLEQAGMIIVGKLNMDEFAMGGSSETGIAGAAHNPWNLTCVAGGSSGGSAAAVAAGLIPVTLGSDTGGSIRQPCSFCGVSGIKPTYGSVSRYGLIAYASSFDQIGPIGRNIEDSAALLSVISGADSKDSTCIITKPFDFSETNKTASGKIGLPKNYFDSKLGIEDDVKSAVLAAAAKFESLGFEIEEFEMPLTDYMISAYYIIACAEASSNLSRYDGLKYGYRTQKDGSLADLYKNSRSEGFGLEIKRRIMLGSFVLSSGYYDAYYKKALQARALIKNEYDRLFSRYDMILSPVAPTTAYKIGENISDPIKMYTGDIYTVSVNLAGLPAVSLPCGFDGQGLPIGLQLIGPAFSENCLVNAARIYQSETDYHNKKPGGELL